MSRQGRLDLRTRMRIQSRTTAYSANMRCSQVRIGSVFQSALITIVAVLIGGALLGIVGAVVAIPIAAALQLLEILFPRLDNV